VTVSSGRSPEQPVEPRSSIRSKLRNHVLIPGEDARVGVPHDRGRDSVRDPGGEQEGRGAVTAWVEHIADDRAERTLVGAAVSSRLE
jgi:hypothetical protein